MPDPARVDVLVPTYQHAATLAAAVSSFAQQSHPNTWVHILDDGSTDGSARIGAQLARRFANVRFTRRRRAGLVDALNVLVAQSNAPYVALAAADCAFLTTKLAAQLRLLAARPQVGACFCFVDVDPMAAADGRGALAAAAFNWQRSPKRLAADLLYDNILCTPTALLRRRALRALGAFDASLPRAHDYAAWLRLAQMSKLAVLAEPLLRLLPPAAAPAQPSQPDVAAAGTLSDGEVARAQAMFAPRLLAAHAYLRNAKTCRDFLPPPQQL